MPIPLPTLEALLDASAAHEAFKAEVLEYAAHRVVARLATVGHPPRVKVLRVVAHLLESEPALAIDRVRLRAVAGCADFRGEITVHTADGAERTWDFAWDCRWRAREAGYVDMLGYPDQSRAAREFDFRCFAQWRERAPAPRVGAPSTDALMAGD